jgi:catechol 2,3-dioxygenase-like lactoylglutathione lyase family enzyme
MKTLRSIFPWILWLLLGSIGVFSQPIPISRVEAIGFTVSDMDRSVDYYTRVLHFQKVSDVERSGASVERFKGLFGVRIRIVRLRLGEEELELSEYIAPQGIALPLNFQSNDLSFQHVAIVVSDIDQAYVWLRQNHVQHVSSGPQTLPMWNPQAGGIQAFYFKDPDGHVLEIIHFPLGKGDPRWQQRNRELFEGIDHTAIAVSNTEKSLAFYKDKLGMRITGTSENYGDEQEHLNNVFGARLRITSLRASRGPGVELLEYLVPKTGKRIPEDRKANDLAHWETLVNEEDVKAAWTYFKENHIRLISAGVETIDGDAPDARAGFLLEDPDGHVIGAMNNAATDQAAMTRAAACLNYTQKGQEK